MKKTLNVVHLALALAVLLLGATAAHAGRSCEQRR